MADTSSESAGIPMLCLVILQESGMDSAHHRKCRLRVVLSRSDLLEQTDELPEDLSGEVVGESELRALIRPGTLCLNIALRSTTELRKANTFCHYEHFNGRSIVKTFEVEEDRKDIISRGGCFGRLTIERTPADIGSKGTDGNGVVDILLTKVMEDNSDLPNTHSDAGEERNCREASERPRSSSDSDKKAVDTHSVKRNFSQQCSQDDERELAEILASYYTGAPLQYFPTNYTGVDLRQQHLTQSNGRKRSNHEEEFEMPRKQKRVFVH